MFFCSFVALSDSIPAYTFNTNCTGREDHLAECITIINNSTCSSGYIAITCNGKTTNEYIANTKDVDNVTIYNYMHTVLPKHNVALIWTSVITNQEMNTHFLAKFLIACCYTCERECDVAFIYCIYELIVTINSHNSHCGLKDFPSDKI